MVATIAGIPLADVIDAYGSRTAVVRAMGYTRGPAGSQAFKDFRAAERTIDRAARGQHAEITPRSGIGANLAAKLDPTWVMVNAALNRWERAHPGQQPQNIRLTGVYQVGPDDSRDRTVNFPAGDLDLLRADVDEFVTAEFGGYGTTLDLAAIAIS